MRFKSFFAIPLSICLLCASVSTTAAATSITNPETEEEIFAYLASSPTATTTNEYDILKEQQADARAVLKSRTASEEEIEEAKEILSVDPVEYFYDLQKKGENYLEEQGYPAEQIEAIMEFDGSEDAIYRASASVTTDLLILSREMLPNGKAVVEAKYVFSWSGVPFLRSTDFVGLSVSDFFYSENSGDSVVYYKAEDGSKKITENPAVEDMPHCENRAAGMDLPMQIISNRIYYYPTSGYISARFNSLDNDQTSVAGTYAHAALEINFSPALTLSLRTGASESIRFDLEGDFKEMGYEDMVVAVY